MTDRTKSFIIIFTTLFIGFLAGFLTSSSLSRFRLDHLRGRMQAEEKFERAIVESLELDEAQREAIRPVVNKYFPEIRQMQRAFRQQMGGKMDSLKADLKPHLKPEQVKKMNEHHPFGPPFGRKGKHGHRKKHHSPRR